MLFVTPWLSIPLSEIEIRFARSSGPGGQNVNKLSTKAVLHWKISENRTLPPDLKARIVTRYHSKINEDGELFLSCDSFRNQLQNRREVEEKLRTLVLNVLFPPKLRKKTRITRASREKRLIEKRHASIRKSHRRRPGPEDD